MKPSIQELGIWTPPGVQEFQPYIRPIRPPVDAAALNLDLLEGEERRRLRTPVTGDLTLALYYRGLEAAVASLAMTEEDLRVLQLQGARSRKSYRVATGVDWTQLFADQIRTLAAHPVTPFYRLVMPAPYAIQGLSEEIAVRENAAERYMRFAAIAGLAYSDQEKAYIRDIK